MRVQGSGFSIFVSAGSLVLSEDSETDILNATTANGLREQRDPA